MYLKGNECPEIKPLGKMLITERENNVYVQLK